MTETTKPFVYRESVQAYFASPEVQFSVDQLLARKIKYVPQTFSRGEVLDFYKACLAARQTQIDYVQDMFDLWVNIWPELGPGWQPVPYDPGDEELNLDPQVRFDEGYFQRNFVLQGTGLSAGLWISLSSKSSSGSELELGCLLTRGSRSLFRKTSTPVDWIWGNDDGFFRFSTDVGVSENGLDLTPFIAAAQRAVHTIHELARQ